jgi:hypothetical protein
MTGVLDELTEKEKETLRLIVRGHDAKSWSDLSDEVRTPLGAVLSREAIGYRYLNAPPHGFLEVQFRTDFAARKGVVETVTLERENGQLRVVGYIIG